MSDINAKKADIATYLLAELDKNSEQSVQQSIQVLRDNGFSDSEITKMMGLTAIAGPKTPSPH